VKAFTWYCLKHWQIDCLDVGKDVAGAMQRAIPVALADTDVQRRLHALGILQASPVGGRSHQATDTTLRSDLLTYPLANLSALSITSDASDAKVHS
jgi:uncharacterized protein YcaQ